MKKLFMSAVALLFAGALWAQENPLWMRHCAISPDGTTIAFTYKGDIFTVPVSGGKATQITTNPAFDTTPIWSPDSKQIAFASDRMGSMDVFIVSKDRLLLLMPDIFYLLPISCLLPKMPDSLQTDNFSRYIRFRFRADVL